MNRLNRKFFSRDVEIVAKQLLGKILIRKLKTKQKSKIKILKSKIIETEAYYDNKDPASRACKSGDLKTTMEMKAGTILVYGVHNQWLMNIVTGKKGKAQAVLIRSLKPINFKARTSGPGLLTRALKITKKFHKKDIVNNREIYFLDNKTRKKIFSSKRIGIKRDLKKDLRFYIKP